MTSTGDLTEVPGDSPLMGQPFVTRSSENE